MRQALSALGDPHLRLPQAIHVAGTNGKGSTCAVLSAIAQAHSLRAHAFTKPHLFRVNERIRVAGEIVSDTQCLDALARVRKTGAALSHFEAQVCAAFVCFSETPADITIIETGLGGALDATNVIARPAACAITPIDFDHVALLGPTLADIARHKAGILKVGAPAVCARQSEEVSDIIAARAAEIGAPLWRAGVDWDCYAARGGLVVETPSRLFDLPPPSLPGPHQLENAGLAVAALSAADMFPLQDDQVGLGVATAQIPARMQRVHASDARFEAAELWIDGAHNPHAARALRQTLGAMQARAPAHTIAIVGMLARKDHAAFVEALAPAVDRFIATAIAGSDDALPPERIADAAQRAGATAIIEPTLENACARAALQPHARIVICGSLALAREALAMLS
ncbi:MAG: bifunctional folylpolyglutamate synthase/dihydrofolate synthase [Alphaproteobacteria bacterium]|nr:bifunctional folylpolyglutamate synthase/dihydrofolate synthase [Alphaproteobacteria bacterium]